MVTKNNLIKIKNGDCINVLNLRSITRSYYRNSVGIIIVYDITNHQSFEHVSDWLAEAEANISGPDPSQCVFLIVGHKADLNAKREVLYEEGEYLAKYRKAKFVETSALSGENVNVSYSNKILFY